MVLSKPLFIKDILPVCLNHFLGISLWHHFSLLHYFKVILYIFLCNQMLWTELCPHKMHMLKSWPSLLHNTPLFANKVFIGLKVKMRSLDKHLPHYDQSSHKKKKCGHRHVQKDNMWKLREKMAINIPRNRSSPHSSQKKPGLSPPWFRASSLQNC